MSNLVPVHVSVLIARQVANRLDPDQMPHSVASDLGLHCLLRHLSQLLAAQPQKHQAAYVWDLISGHLSGFCCLGLCKLFWLIVIVLGFNDKLILCVILCRFPDKGRKVIEEIVEEMKERGWEERGTEMKVKKQKK